MTFHDHLNMSWLINNHDIFDFIVIIVGNMFVLLSIFCPYRVLKRSYILICSSFVILILLRWKTILFNGPLDLLDETVYISRVETLFKDPIFWRSVDGTSAGPLHHYPLLLLKYLGFKVDYCLLHLCSVSITGLIIFLSFKALSQQFTNKIALFSTLMPFALYGFGEKAEFTHYFSEIWAITFILISLNSYLKFNKSNNIIFFYFSAFFIGLVPFSKLQALPIAFGLQLWMFIKEYRKVDFWKWGNFFLVLISPLLFSILILYYLGVLEDAYFSYIKSNFILATNLANSYSPDLATKISRTMNLIFTAPILLIITPIIIIIIIIFYFNKLQKGIERHKLLYAMLLMTPSLYSIFIPGTGFPHYLNFIIFPICIVIAVILEIFEKEKINFNQYFSITGTQLITIILLFPILFYLNYERKNILLSKNEKISKAAQFIINKSNGDSLGLWGYKVDLYVETGRYQATRDTVPMYQIADGVPLNIKEIYIERYINDLDKNKPSVFVDTFGDSDPFFNNKSCQVVNFPNLYSYINANYTLIKEINDVRIYFLKRDYETKSDT